MALVSWTFAKNRSIAVGPMTCGAPGGMYRSCAISYITPLLICYRCHYLRIIAYPSPHFSMPSHRQYCIRRLSFTILLYAFLLTDNTAYIRVNCYSHIDCLTSVIYTGRVDCSRGHPLFRSYGRVGYLCGGLRPLLILDLCSHPLCPPCIFVLYPMRMG
jgi:hypothetical protein